MIDFNHVPMYNVNHKVKKINGAIKKINIGPQSIMALWPSIKALPALIVLAVWAFATLWLAVHRIEWRDD